MTARFPRAVPVALRPGLLALALFCTLLLGGCAAPSEVPPPALTSELVQARLGMGVVRDFAWSADGTLVAVASGSGRAYLWNAVHHQFVAVLDVTRAPALGAPSTGKPQPATLRAKPGAPSPAATPPPAAVTAIAFADAATVVTASEDGKLRAWDVKDPGQVRTSHEMSGGRALLSLAVSPDGHRAYAGNAEGHILAWDLTSDRPVQDIGAHAGAVHALALSPDGATLFSGGADGIVSSWKAADLTSMAHSQASEARGKPVPVLSLAIQEGGDLFAGFGDGTVRQLAPANLTATRPFTGVGSPVTAVAQRGPYLAAGGGNHQLLVWNLQKPNENPVTLTGNYGSILSLAFTPDGRLGAGGDEKVIVLHRDFSAKAQTPNPTLDQIGLPATVLELAYNPDGRLMASAGGPDVLVWEPASGSLAAVVKTSAKGRQQAVAWSSKGLLASGGEDGEVRLFDATGALVATARHTKAVTDVAFSPDGVLLASGSWDRTVQLSKVQDNALVAATTLRGHRVAISSVSFSGDGKSLASSSWDHSVAIWDVATGTRTLSLSGMAGPVFATAFDPKRPMVVAGGWHGQVWFYQSDNGASLAQLTQEHPPAPPDVVFVARFTADGRGLATGSADRVVQFWDPSSQQPRQIQRNLQGFRAGVHALAWSLDQKSIAIGTGDGAIYVLTVPQEALPR